MLLFILALVVGVYTQNESSCSTCIMWQPCPDADGVECASYQVPLDYANPGVGNATLALARIKAFTEPRLGTLFTNPGGPGGSGTQTMKSGEGQLISTITGGQYDILSWDPRGVNQTVPLATCGFTSADQLAQVAGPLVSTGIDARGNFTDQDDIDNFFAQLNATDSSLIQYGEQCMREQGDVLQYIGTAAVVRDMVSLSDCLEGPGKPINYWGFSYGTVIGNYFVNMFPDRVGRVIIDGVVDSITWATEPSFKLFGLSLSAADSVFAGFAQNCAEAGPGRCALAQNGSTAASVSQAVHDIIDTAYELHKAGTPNFNLTSGQIRGILYSPLPPGGMYTPGGWGQLASMFAGFNSSFASATAGMTVSPRMPIPVHRPRDAPDSSLASLAEGIAGKAILCVDSIDQDNVTTEQVFNETARVTHEITPLFGELIPVEPGFNCHRFPIRAVERFTGPFNHTLAYPILVIGNEADPITPFDGAQKIADTLGNSARLVKQNGFGHSSLAETSNCTHALIHDYFLNGTLPEQGTVCQVDQILFPPNSTAST